MLAPDRHYITLDDQNFLQSATSDPAGFVAQLPDFVTLDEVQRVPELLLAIKRRVDADGQPGQFLLTGSANLLKLPRLADSLAGRMESLFLHPFSEAEKEGAAGQFLQRLLNGEFEEPLRGKKDMERSTLPERLVMGGYPEPNRRTQNRARQWHRQYLRSIMERDIRDVARIKDSNDVARLLELLALRTVELLNVSALGNDLNVDRQTADRHLSILEKLFLVSPKVHVCDSGLAATLAGLHPEDWNAKRDRFGHLLESFVLQQLVAQAGWTDPDLRFWHYRDKDKVEVDCVITRGRKVWGIEVKAAATVTPSDGAGLHRLAEQARSDFQGGVVLYDGDSVIPLGASGFLGVPLSRLWEY